MDEEYVSSRPNGVRDSCGVGNLIIPKDKDIAQYIERCYRTGMVSIMLENGGTIDNVIVSKSNIRDLEFPSDYTKLGSQVVWINKPNQNQPIVIGVINKSNEFVSINQDQSSLRKASSNGVFEVIVDSKKGIIIVNSSSTLDSNGDIYIISTNKNKTSKLSVNVSGSISIETPEITIVNSKKISLIIKDQTVDENIASIIYEKGIGFSYQDEFGNEFILNRDNVQIKPVGVLNVGEGNEPMVLGSTLKDAVVAEQTALTTLLNAINNAPTAAGDGGATFKAALVAAIATIQRGNYNSILSRVSNTD